MITEESGNKTATNLQEQIDIVYNRYILASDKSEKKIIRKVYKELASKYNLQVNFDAFITELR